MRDKGFIVAEGKARGNSRRRASDVLLNGLTNFIKELKSAVSRAQMDAKTNTSTYTYTQK